jgi:hypothetical protein
VTRAVLRAARVLGLGAMAACSHPIGHRDTPIEPAVDGGGPMFDWPPSERPTRTVELDNGKPYRYLMRRELSGVTSTLRAVELDYGHAYAAGDDGVVLHRGAHGGWRREAVPTTRRLRALVSGAHELGGVTSDISCTETFTTQNRSWDRAQITEIFAVGDAGTVLRRDPSGVWAVEPTPTTADLHAVVRHQDRLYAVGDRGTLIERTHGAWRAIASHTSADLRWFDGRVAVGRGGAVIDCAPWDRERPLPGEQLACVPRAPASDADLLTGVVQGDRWHAYGVGGTVVRATRQAPIELALDPAVPGGATITSAAASMSETSLGEMPPILVGTTGTLVFQTPTPVAVMVEGAPALFGVVTEAADAFVVGAGGTIVHLQAEGARCASVIDL